MRDKDVLGLITILFLGIFDILLLVILIIILKNSGPHKTSWNGETAEEQTLPRPCLVHREPHGRSTQCWKCIALGLQRFLQQQKSMYFFLYSAWLALIPAYLESIENKNKTIKIALIAIIKTITLESKYGSSKNYKYDIKNCFAFADQIS